MKQALAIVLCLAIATLTIEACHRQITEQDAIAIAKDTLGAQTKFYAKIGNETKTVSNVSVGSASAYFDKTYWHVALHVQGNDDTGALRQNDVEVLINPDGSVAGMGAGKTTPPPGIIPPSPSK